MEFSEDFHFDSETTELQLPKPIVEENLTEISRSKVVDRLIDEHRSKNVFTDIIDENQDLEDKLRDITTIVNKNATNINEEEKYNFKNVLTEYENISSFMDMKLSKPILKTLTDDNITKPTAIQEACIPVGLMNKDICACAKTGSGKTLAFLIPIVEKLIRSPAQKGRYTVPRAVVLSPTRELALQIYQVAQSLIRFCPRLSCQLVSGGLNRSNQEASLRNGADIIIATPGRLIDIIHNTPNFDLLKIEFLVLDEADKMLDEYFIEQIKEVVKGCSPTRQVMLFSATMTENVKDLISLSLKDPFKIFVNRNNDVADNLQQEVIRIRTNRPEDRESMLLALVCRGFSKRTIVFLPTKSLCHRIHILLGLLGIRCGQLHSNMTQAQRLDALGRFAKADDEEHQHERVDVLVGTDLAARGLDVANVETVINYSLPTKYEQYIHRVGRTARNMKSGRAISLVAEDERNMLKMICKGSKNGVKMRKIDPVVVEFYTNKIRELNATVTEITDAEKLEKESQIAEIELEKAMKRMDNTEELKVRRFNWFSNRDAKGVKLKRNAGKDEDEEEGDGQTEVTKKKAKKDNGGKHFSRKIEKEAKKKNSIKPKNRKK